MKIVALLSVLLLPVTVPATELLVEAEAFQSRGGWTLDAQFVHTMGSPYLLAHGLGTPVEEAQTTVEFPDAVATGGLVFCLHYPGEEQDFRNRMDLIPVKPYGIPFRCLYSRNIENLMMAGRCVSATHIAYSSIKLMKTGGQMGVAVGAAAALCNKHNTIPRGVYEKHLSELKDAVYERGEYTEALKPQQVEHVTSNGGSP